MTLEKLDHVKVGYQDLPGWTQNISRCKKFNQLPKEAQNYIQLIEQATGLPVELIGVGANRDEIICKM